MITILRDDESYNTIYGIIVADDGIDIDYEICKIKSDPEFQKKFTDDDDIPYRTIEGVLDILSEKFPIEYESDFVNAYI